MIGTLIGAVSAGIGAAAETRTRGPSEREAGSGVLYLRRGSRPGIRI